MKRQTAGRSAKPRVCALCGGPMMASRPMVLLQTLEGLLIGPYHFGCAEKMVIDSRSSKLSLPVYGEELGRAVPPAREETLPW